MKKIFFSIICIMLSLLTGCKKTTTSNNTLDAVTKYLSSLDSYELKGDMVIHRDSNDINIEVMVSYLSPNYYRVSFNNPNGKEQLIIKNDDGVFVLTPSLNKEFKFDSEWPLNSGQAYLLSSLLNSIKEDSKTSFTLDGDVAEISCKLANKNNNATKLNIYYNVKDNVLKKVILLDDNDVEKVVMTFKEFTPNKNINKDIFNTKLIMDEKGSTMESTANAETENEASIAITCGYVCDGATLDSSIINEESTILCYTGEKEYTIVVNKAPVYQQNIFMDKYFNFDFVESGLLLIGENLSRFFIDQLEVSIYSSDLTTEEVLAIATDITII